MPVFLAVPALFGLVAVFVHRVDVGLDAVDLRLGVQPSVAARKSSACCDETDRLTI